MSRKPAAPAGATRFGADVDEVGGVGDEIDTLSLRDIAVLRYIRHHEWMELAIGSAVETQNIIPPKFIPDEETYWSLSDDKSVESRLKELQSEISELEAFDIDQVDPDMKKHQILYRNGIQQLRSAFGTSDGHDLAAELIQKLEQEFGVAVVERRRIKALGNVRQDLGLEQAAEQTDESKQAEAKAKAERGVQEENAAVDELVDLPEELDGLEDLEGLEDLPADTDVAME